MTTTQISLHDALCNRLSRKAATNKPTIVCLCGSTRFMQAYQDATLSETNAGKIVLCIGINTKSDQDLLQAGIHLDKAMLDVLHLYKIDLAEEVLILNVGGYVGESTLCEVLYAYAKNKPVRWLEPEHALALCEVCGELYTQASGYCEPQEYSFCGDCCHW